MSKKRMQILLLCGILCLTQVGITTVQAKEQPSSTEVGTLEGEQEENISVPLNSDSMEVAAKASPPLKLDEQTVYLAAYSPSYSFVIAGNNDTENITVSSSNEDVATVTLEDGQDSQGARYRIQAKSAGTATITVTYDGRSASIEVTAEDPAPLKLDTQTVYLAAKTPSYDFLVNDNNDTENITVSSSNEDVATVTLEDGKDTRGARYRIQANAAGTATITVTYDGRSASIEVTAEDPAPLSKLLQAPLIYQMDKYPTGCESVSAVMALQYAGFTISVDSFIDNYLDKSGLPFDPNRTFGGNPRSIRGYGCYSPVIKRALDQVLSGKTYSAKLLKDVPLTELCSQYINQGIPVILWATRDMKVPSIGSSWVYKGKKIEWVIPEHCLLLVGYDENHYIFNDPQKQSLAYYKKADVEQGYKGLFSQAIVIEKTIELDSGSITLDTVNYQMSQGNLYDIGVTITDSKGTVLSGAHVQELVNNGTLKVSDSRTGSIVDLKQLSNGNFRVIGKNPGTCYIVYQIMDGSQAVTHASIRIDVADGIQQQGAATRNTSYWKFTNK